jgi:hypothetical protein
MNHSQNGIFGLEHHSLSIDMRSNSRGPGSVGADGWRGNVERSRFLFTVYTNCERKIDQGQASSDRLRSCRGTRQHP